MRKSVSLSLAALLCAAPAVLGADEKSPLELKVVATKDGYAWGRDQAPKEFKKMLDEMAEKIKKGEDPGRMPNPPAVDLMLQITNKSDKEVTVYVGGDSNQVTLDLKGPGVVALKPLLGFTADFRLPKAESIAPGKSYNLQVKQLSDGFRGASRWIYWTEPGEYTISATYQLATNDGGKGPLLKSEPVKIKVEDRK